MDSQPLGETSAVCFSLAPLSLWLTDCSLLKTALTTHITPVLLLLHWLPVNFIDFKIQKGMTKALCNVYNYTDITQTATKPKYFRDESYYSLSISTKGISRYSGASLRPAFLMFGNQLMGQMAAMRLWLGFLASVKSGKTTLQSQHIHLYLFSFRPSLARRPLRSLQNDI